MQKTPLLPSFSLQELFSHSDQEIGEPILDRLILVILNTHTQKAHEVACLLDVDTRKLSSAVELLTGLPLGSFLLEWRYLQSLNLLRHTDLPYEEVAHRCGFRDLHSLIHLYRARQGMTPYTFRTGRRIRNSNYASNQ